MLSHDSSILVYPVLGQSLVLVSAEGVQHLYLVSRKSSSVDLHLDQFSDLVWADVLSKDLYLEHLSPNHFFIFECLEDQMNLIAVKITNIEQDITTPEGWQWLLHHIHDESVTFYRSSKKYEHDRKEELYGMILKGTQISSDKRYKSILEFLA